MAKNPNPTRITDAIWWFWEQFDAHEKSVALSGIYAGKAGYHNYRSALPRTDYSSGRDVNNDKLGPSNKACAIDLTMNNEAMRRYSKRLADAGRAKDPRLYWQGQSILREFIGTLDSKTVYCWVYVGGRPLGAGGDSGPDPGRSKTHLWHVHLSVVRKMIDNKPALAQILSIMKGEPRPGTSKKDTTTMPSAKDLLNTDIVPNASWRPDAKTNPTVTWMWAIRSTWDEAHQANVKAGEAVELLKQINTKLDALKPATP